jgi:DNA sulfur modification protein DndD
VSLAEVNTAEQRKNLSRAYSEVLGIKKYEDIKNELGKFATQTSPRFSKCK